MRVTDGVPVAEIEALAEQIHPAEMAGRTARALLGFVPMVLGWLVGWLLVWVVASFRLGYMRGRLAAARPPAPRVTPPSDPAVPELMAARARRVVG